MLDKTWTVLFSMLFLSVTALGQDWSENAKLPHAIDGLSAFPRQNILNLEQEELNQHIHAGYQHAMIYPVSVTELLIPLDPLQNFFDLDPNDPLRKLLIRGAKEVTPFKSIHEMMSWLGINSYPTARQNLPTQVPMGASHDEKELGMGATIIHREYETGTSRGLTFSCAACHTSSVFGKKVVGLTNRFPRANEFFSKAKSLAPFVMPKLFQKFLDTTISEVDMFKQAQSATWWLGAKTPTQIGLDTSLAQVALSLAKRAEDEYATKYIQNALNPRDNELEHKIADSKPMVWWNVKYKTRFLSDGSIVSGNPIHTNFLWNEIGRSVDLKKLETWLHENQQTIDELTAAVFSTNAPHYTDFFDASDIDINKAKQGEKIFIQSCQKCHGRYEKNWSLSNADTMNETELIKTHKIHYHEKTPVKNVGTDPGRWQGMQYFAKDLNRLKISKTIGTKVEPQEGYVPPPLEGIWIRWPYFHNNSIPNLCELVTPPEARVKTFWTGEAKNPNTDFDKICNGYPVKNAPEHWKKNKDYLYDTTREGLSNSGHYKMFLDEQGQELYSWEEKMELIEFLKTL